jgi:hypothetical protein
MGSAIPVGMGKSIDARAFVVVGSVVLAACSTTIVGDAPDGTSSGGTSGASGASGTSGYTDDPNDGATRPPPSIASVSPLSGDYGTLVTITGDNLDEASAQLVLAGPAEQVKIAKPASGTGSGQAGAVVTKWSKTEIQFKYPFPAEGGVSITTKSGQAAGGSFAPSWRPGSPISGKFTRRELLSIVSPAAGSLVAAFDGSTGPSILIAKNGAMAAKAYDRGASALRGMSLYVTADGTVDGVYPSGGSLFQLTDATGAAATATTGVAATDAAGGHDESGAYAWIRNGSGQVVQVRGPTWAETGTAVADPTPAGAPGPSMAVASDHSLIVGWGLNSTGSFPLYDHTARPVMRRLRAGLTTFDAQRTGGSGADDRMIWTRFRAGPDGRVFSYYCANDTGTFSSPSVDCGEGYIDGLGGLGEPTTAAHGERISGWNATTTFTTSCDTKTATLSVGPEGSTAQAVPVLFPCASVTVLGVAVDPSDAPVLLVSSANYLYSPRKR